MAEFKTYPVRTNEEVEKKRAVEAAENHLARVRELREEWNAPGRAASLKDKDKKTDGPWGEAYRDLKAKLGTGFLIGLVGKRGPGKTQIGYELMVASTGALKSAYYCTAIEFFLELRAANQRGSAESELAVFNKYRRVKLLVIDEVGKRGQTEWEDRILFELIDKRYQDEKDTLLISNEDEATFTRSLGSSIASRMSQTGGVKICDWPSFR